MVHKCIHNINDNLMIMPAQMRPYQAVLGIILLLGSAAP